MFSNYKYNIILLGQHMALVLTQQIPPPSITGATLPTTIVTSGSAPIQADSVSTLQYPSVKWIVTITTATQTRMFEIAALHRNGTNPLFTLYSDIGDRILVSADVVMAGTDMVLELVNNSGQQTTISVVRILTTA